MFTSIIEKDITAAGFFGCIVAALILGILLALAFSYKTRFSKGFMVTLALLPSIVTIIIMMVNGSIGAGVAVAGTFTLVRFRSEAGTARQITALFLAMALGIALGMGYVFVAVAGFAVITACFLLLTLLHFGEEKGGERLLKITIPENMDYVGMFDDLFETYTVSHTLDRVRTTNMGTLYELSYTVNLKDENQLKSFMDQIRTRNGNLTVSCGRVDAESRM